MSNSTLRLRLCLAAGLALFAMPHLLAADSSAFVIINGGYTPLANYAWHERDIVSFNEGLFKKKALILNAGGAGTPYVKAYADGNLLRDSKGVVVMGISDLEARPEAATKANVTKLFEEVSASGPSRVSVVYGDHGNSSGVALWNDGDLSARDIADLNSRFPESTMVRSIHLHCMGGAAIVSPARVVPSTLKAFQDFAARNYRRNVCAVTMSDGDETGQYFAMNRWPNNEWKPIFTNNPKLTLKQLKEEFRSDPNIRGTPALTSDYFIHDLSKFLCDYSAPENRVDESKASNAHAKGGLKDSVASSDLGLAELSAADRKSFCDSAPAQALRKANARIEFFYQVQNEIHQVENLWKRQFIKNTSPDFYESYRIAQERIDEMDLKALSENRELTAIELDRRRKLEVDYTERYAKMVEGLDLSPEYLAYTEAFNKTWMDEHAEAYPNFYDGYFSRNPERALRDLSNDMAEFIEDAKKDRKNIATKVNSAQREALKNWLKSPGVPSGIKELYEGLQACESSALN
jgi:hypothetical protein